MVEVNAEAQTPFLLSDQHKCITPVVLEGHRANMSLIDKKVTNCPMNPTDLNGIVKTRNSEKIKGFSSYVIHTQTMTMFPGCNLHVMMHTLCEGDKPLPHGLAVQNTYTEMMTGNKSVVMMVRNLTATHIILKKNATVAVVVATNAVPNTQVPPGMVEQLDTAQRIQMGRPKMTVEQ